MNDVNACYENFISTFSGLNDKYFPKQHKRVIAQKQNKPRIAQGILFSNKKKHGYHKESLRKKTPSAISKYNAYKNKLTKIVRASDKSRFMNKFESAKTDIKKTWQLIKNVIKRNQNSPSERTGEINSGDLILKEQSQIVNKFNDYFTNIGSTLASKIRQIDGNHLEFIKNYFSNTIFLNPSNELELKSPGYDDISSKVIKAVIDSIHLPLCDIFNKSLQTGSFPDNLKIAKVVPIYKGDDKMLVNNDRPISVLPVFSKILETIIFTIISNFVVQNNILSDNQFGFRHNLSTYMALFKLTDKFSKELNNKQYSIGIFWNFPRLSIL